MTPATDSTEAHSTPHFSTLAEAFIQHGHYLRNWSPKTVRTYRQGLNTFQQSLEARGDWVRLPGAPLLCKTDLDAFVIGMRQKGLTPGGCNMYIRSVNSFLSWLLEEGHLKEKLRIRLLSDPRKAPVPFSDRDVQLILSAKSKRFGQKRLYTILVTLLDSGMRIEECLTIQVQNVDLENCLIKIVGKGNKERIVPMSTELRKKLFVFTQARAKRGINSHYLFCAGSGGRLSYRNVHRDMFVLCQNLGIKGPRVSPHTLRHYFACTYIRNGGDIYTLSRILGHTSVTTTQLYLRSMGVEQISRAHSQYSPLSKAR